MSIEGERESLRGDGSLEMIGEREEYRGMFREREESTWSSFICHVVWPLRIGAFSFANS